MIVLDFGQSEDRRRNQREHKPPETECSRAPLLALRAPGRSADHCRHEYKSQPRAAFEDTVDGGEIRVGSQMIGNKEGTKIAQRYQRLGDAIEIGRADR